MAGAERIVHAIHGTHKHDKKKTHKVASDFKASAADCGESKAASDFAKMLDRRSFNAPLFSHFFQAKNMESQFVFFDIMINMIAHWADLYRSGEVGPHSNPRVLGICRWADRVEKAAQPDRR